MNDQSQQALRWRDAFRVFERDVESLTEGLSQEAFNDRPAPEQWSVGQCLDHLNEAGGRLVPRLEAALEHAREEGRAVHEGTSRLRLFDRLFVWSMAPGHWLKLPSPEGYRPAAGALEQEETVRAFQTVQERLASCAEAAAGVDWSAIQVTSPVSRFLRLSVGGWLAGTLAHQRRHFEQARAARTRVVETG